MKKAILLLNLGTPDAPETKAVARYLKEFLMDPFVIDIPKPLRWLLVKGIIAPFRSPKSAHAYQNIWMKDHGSPLLYHTKTLTEKLRQRLQGDYQVEFAMRYGNPSIESVLNKLKSSGVEDLIVIPLYPQYAMSSSLSSIEKVRELIADSKYTFRKVEVLRDFYNQPEYIESFVQNIKKSMSQFNPDYVLFSFHGIPERHVHKTVNDCSQCLKVEDGCAKCLPQNSLCYRGQSYFSAHQMAQKLGLKNYRISFQSRLGRDPWIKPYTDAVITELAQKGVKNLLVVCPAFTADCLETVEEISIRENENFLTNGGTKLELVPSLNSEDHWVSGIQSLIQKMESREISGSMLRLDTTNG